MNNRSKSKDQGVHVTPGGGRWMSTKDVLRSSSTGRFVSDSLPPKGSKSSISIKIEPRPKKAG